jgi:cytochrome P450
MSWSPPPTVAPGPRGYRLLTSAIDLYRDPLRALAAAWTRYGDVVRLGLGGSLVGHLLVHPSHVQHVLQDRQSNYRKIPVYNDKLKRIAGESVLTSEGDVWRQHRRLIQPAFHAQRLAALGPAMTDATLAMLRRWEPYAERGEPLDVAAEMMRLTLTIVARTLFAADLSHDVGVIARAVTAELEDTDRRMRAFVELPEWLPLPSQRKTRAARGTLDAIVSRIIAERRACAAGGDDVLSLLLQARDGAGQPLSDPQLQDEVRTLLLAGHETTAVALGWIWYLLSRHPDVARRLRAELASVLAGRTPTVDDLPRLSYTRMVLEEAMRLYPPAWLIGRSPRADDEIAGYRIPAGSGVFLCVYLTHRHPAFWENPEGFDPSRFAPERAAGRSRFAYVPFGGGPRQCLGGGFAMMEAVLILATVAQEFRLHLVPGRPVVPHPSIALRQRHGVWVSLAKATTE